MDGVKFKIKYKSSKIEDIKGLLLGLPYAQWPQIEITIHDILGKL